MKNLKYTIVSLIAAAMLIVGCQSEQGAEPPLTVSEADIQPHIQELASDAYFGRMPFGAGDQITVDYLVEQCKEIGLEPATMGATLNQCRWLRLLQSP